MNEEIELIYPSEIIAGCISVYRNVWPNPEKTIEKIENFSSNNTEHGFVPASIDSLKKIIDKTRTNMHMSLNNSSIYSEQMKEIYDQYYKLVWATGIGYNKHFSLYEPTYINEGFNILRYQTGQEYKAHYDGGTAGARSISPILYLNDDYDGGELEFVNFDIKIKPESGMLVVFPASFPYAHIAHPVTNGTKYAIVTWLHDRPIDDISKQRL
jgi:hypothetical protein